ncbi:MAG: CHAD domain-containing protein [Gammaproteobacteria bacterium]|nr:CHAD domain-containing protein [Gammaproteobacteria bacterium]MDH3411571.1 CHAD domain-containing protein [Gammaproteobacteria bacterium]
MSYCLRRNEGVEENIKRIALEQIEHAIAEIRDTRNDLHDTVHRVRKRCKKIRALVRLIRPEFGKFYHLENAWYRDAARELSHARDAQVLVLTHDKLMRHYHDAGYDFSPVRDQLVRCRRGVSDNPRRMAKCFEVVLQRMKSGRKRVPLWSLDMNSQMAISKGLKKTYKRGQKAMSKALAAPADENLHDWRKQVKYHWYHSQILRPIAQGELQKRCEQTNLLSDLLGDEHDLGVLRRALAGSSEGHDARLKLRSYFDLIDRRRMELRTQADTVGRRIYAEKAKDLSNRIRARFPVWESRHESRVDSRRAG